jgi:SP family general alpha glucoside:H+ symporter-like MFS transporter
MDMLFSKGVSARKFATTEINAFEGTVEGGVMDKYRLEVSHVERLDT